MKKITLLIAAIFGMSAFSASAQQHSDTVKVFANPTRTAGPVTIESSSPIQSVVLYTEAAKKLTVWRPTPSNKVTIILPKVAEGFYYLGIISSKNTVAKKLFISK